MKGKINSFGLAIELVNQVLRRDSSVFCEASVVQWLCHSPCKPGVAGSIRGFSSRSDGTINRGPMSI